MRNDRELLSQLAIDSDQTQHVMTVAELRHMLNSEYPDRHVQVLTTGGYIVAARVVQPHEYDADRELFKGEGPYPDAHDE